MDLGYFVAVKLAYGSRKIKDSLKLNGSPLIQYVIDKLSQQDVSITINTNRVTSTVTKHLHRLFRFFPWYPRPFRWDSSALNATTDWVRLCSLRQPSNQWRPCWAFLCSSKGAATFLWLTMANLSNLYSAPFPQTCSAKVRSVFRGVATIRSSCCTKSVWLSTSTLATRRTALLISIRQKNSQFGTLQ